MSFWPKKISPTIPSKDQKREKRKLPLLEGLLVVSIVSCMLVVRSYLALEQESSPLPPDTSSSSPLDTGKKKEVWGEKEIVAFMKKHPHRAYFSRFFRDGGFRVGMEVGVASGRFSELFLKDNNGIGHWTWYMVEPFPPSPLVQLLPTSGTSYNVRNGQQSSSWFSRNIGHNAHKIFLKKTSLDLEVLDQVGDGSLDFLYLDGLHSYETVKQELIAYYPKIRPGGVIAGHDFCDYGKEEGRRKCLGCDDVPLCGSYTEVATTKKKGRVANMHPVVKAVQEYMEVHQPKTMLYHTNEDFTRESLQRDGFEYDLVITNTRNPSWYFIKPTT